MNNNCTIYETLKSKKPITISVVKALKRIKNGTVKEKIELVQSGKIDKTELSCVIFAGVVESDTRKDEDVKEHSGFFVLDWDNLKDPQTKKNQLKQDPYIFAAWISPSGKGVKALVKCTPNIEAHERLYTAFTERYSDLDTTSKNIARLCFESYDPDLYYNPNCKTWERLKTDEQVAKEREVRKDRRNVKLMDTALAMVRSSQDGEKHEELLKAARLLGGYVAAGRIEENYAINALEEEILKKEIKDPRQAKKTIRDGIEYGKKAPLHEAKKIEKSQEFTKTEDGRYSFLADPEEMKDYEQSILDNTLAMGQSSNIPSLDKHWMFKYNSLDWFGGLDNSGKSFVLWYLATIQAMFNGITVCMASFENGDGEVKKKIKEFYIGKRLKDMTKEELDLSEAFFSKHFILFSSKNLFTWEEFLLRAEVVYDEVIQYDLLIAEPFNALDVPNGLDEHRHNLKATNMLREFKENISSVWVADHVNSFAGRNRDSDGYVKVPWKADISGGQIKANKVESFIIVHRILNDPARKNITELHVQKIRSKETGGEPTDLDDPVKLLINPNYCGFSCNGVDPVVEYWRRKSGASLEQQPPQQTDNPLSGTAGDWSKLEGDPPPF